MQLLEKYATVDGVIQLRHHMPLRDGAQSVDGLSGRFQVLWQIESYDYRYPNEWAMMPIDGEAKVACDRLGLPWIASGDIGITTITKVFFGGDVDVRVNFGEQPFEIGELTGDYELRVKFPDAQPSK